MSIWRDEAQYTGHADNETAMRQNRGNAKEEQLYLPHIGSSF